MVDYTFTLDSDSRNVDLLRHELPEEKVITNHHSKIREFFGKESIKVFYVRRHDQELNKIFIPYKKDFIRSEYFNFQKPYIEVKNHEQYRKKFEKRYIASVTFLDVKDIEKYYFKETPFFYSNVNPPAMNHYDLGEVIFNKPNQDIYLDYPIFEKEKVLKYPILSYLKNNTPSKVIDNLDNSFQLNEETIVWVKDLDISECSQIYTDSIFNLCNENNEPVWFLGVYPKYNSNALLSMGIHDGVKSWNNIDFRITRNVFEPCNKFDLIMIIKNNKVILLFCVKNENNYVLIDKKQTQTKQNLSNKVLVSGSANVKYRQCNARMKELRIYQCPSGIESQLKPIFL